MKYDFTTKLDAAAVRRKIAELLELIRGDNPFDDPVWSDWPLRKVTDVPTPIPPPGRMSLGRTMGRALVRTAHLKVAAQMAGNKDLMTAVDERMTSILDDDWCPTRPRVLTLPKWPLPVDPWPGPRPDELTVNWQDFEQLVSTMVDYHAGLQDGALKDEVAGVIKRTIG
jgi:hypothetical protein